MGGTFWSGLRQIPYLAEKKGERATSDTDLGLSERRAIEDMLKAQVPVGKIADTPGINSETAEN